MILTKPAPFKEAEAKLQSKVPLLTELNTREMMDHTTPQLRDGSFFSSRVIDARILSAFKKGAEEIVNGNSTIPKQRLLLKQLGAQLKYRAEEGKEGTLEDLFSNARIDVMLKTNVSLIRGFGQWQQSNRPGELKAFPALELIRISPREKKRAWIQRWNAARARLKDRTTATEAFGSEDNDESGINAFALKNDPIWYAISRFGVPFAPFDFNSGMGTRAVGYREAVAMGVMDPEDNPIAPKPHTINDLLAASTEGMDEDLVKALQDDLSDDVEISGGLLRFKNERVTERLRERGRTILALSNAFDPSQARGGDGRWISAGQIASFHARAQAGLPIPRKGRNYRAVTESEAQRISRSTGIDVRGYTHSVDESALQHIIKEHGNPITETKRGLVAVTSSDLAQLPRILTRADRITRLADVKGCQRIAYEKIDGHYLFVVEEVRRGRQQLALVTMYKKKRAVLSSTPGFPNAVWQTPEAFRAVNKATTLRDRGQAVLRFLQEGACS